MSKWSEDLPKDLQNKIEIVDEKISSKLEDISPRTLSEGAPAASADGTAPSAAWQPLKIREMRNRMGNIFFI